MLKGKTRIELTDVRTGEKQVVEEENMITNALRDQLRFISAYYSKTQINEKILPLSENAMGGIKLFDGTLEENPDNYYLPNVKKAKVVGYASNDATSGEDPMRGSKNLQESKELENGYQYVWDFATSEANGTIASLGLTTSEGGKSSWNPMYDNVMSFFKVYGDEYIYFAGCDIEAGKYSTIQWNSSDKKAIVKEYRYHNESIDLNHLIYDPILEKQTEVQVDLPRSDNNLNFRDGGDGNWYGVSTAGTKNGNATVYICSINKETLESSVKTLVVQDVSVSSSYIGNNIVFDGYVYLSKYSSTGSGYTKGFYKVKIDNPSDITIIDFEEWTETSNSYNFISSVENGMLYSRGILFDGQEYEKCYIDNQNWLYTSKYKFFIQTQKGMQVINTKGSSSKEDRATVTPSKNVLMSINNLSSPVVKTADKTMKIIYTVTYQE